MRLADVRVRHLKDLVLSLRSSKLAPRTVHNIYGLTHKLFQDAVMDELIDHNPCQLDKSYLGAKRDKDPTWRAGAIFTRAELEGLISDPRIPTDRRMVYALEGLAGLRHGEMAGLRWEDVDFERGVALAHKHKTRKRTGKPKTIFLIADAVEQGIEENLGVDGTAQLIRQTLDDMTRSRSRVIASTEMNDAFSEAAMRKLGRLGVEYKQWITSPGNVCDECTENEDASPIPLDEDFPSGHSNLGMIGLLERS